MPEFMCKEMVHMAVEFSFDGKMYKQIDGVAMSLPLRCILANVFVGYLGNE